MATHVIILSHHTHVLAKSTVYDFITIKKGGTGQSSSGGIKNSLLVNSEWKHLVKKHAFSYHLYHWMSPMMVLSIGK